MIFVYTKDKNEMKRMLENIYWSETFVKSKLCVIAEDKGRVIGASCLRGVLNIWATYVAKEYRNKGIGTALLGNVIIFAKRENYSFIMGEVGWDRYDNIAAKRLSQKLNARKVVDMGYKTVIMWPLKRTTGKLAFIGACLFFSLIPRTFRKKIVKSVAKIA